MDSRRKALLDALERRATDGDERARSELLRVHHAHVYTAEELAALQYYLTWRRIVRRSRLEPEHEKADCDTVLPTVQYGYVKAHVNTMQDIGHGYFIAHTDRGSWLSQVQDNFIHTLFSVDGWSTQIEEDLHRGLHPKGDTHGHNLSPGTKRQWQDRPGYVNNGPRH